MTAAQLRELQDRLDQRLRAEDSRRSVCRFPFNATLSADEQRMLEQGVFDGPSSWEIDL